MKVLVVEDEKSIADNLKIGLEQHKFIVDVAYTGQDGYHLIRDFDYDVIVLDLMLPDMAGEDLCKKLRKENAESYILMLTAKKQISNIVEGLNCGADDYLTKPFEFSELLARIRALLRRSSKNKENLLSTFDLKMNLDKEQVFIRGFSVRSKTASRKEVKTNEQRRRRLPPALKPVISLKLHVFSFATTNECSSCS